MRTSERDVARGGARGSLFRAFKKSSSIDTRGSGQSANKPMTTAQMENTLPPPPSAPTSAERASDDEILEKEPVKEAPPRRLTLWTAFMAVLVAMGGFIYGFDTGQISGFLQMEEFRRRFGQQAPDGRYYFSNVRSGLIVGLLSIGTLFGCLSAAPLSNRIGRKPVIPIGCFIFVVGVTIQIAVGEGEWYGVAIGRLVAGAGVGVLSVMVPTYMSETTPKQVRGAVISCYQLFITIGIFIADCINYGTEDRQDTGSYRITMGVGYIWAIVLGLGILLLPESPRWDFTHNFSARAKRTMAKFYGVPSEHRAIREEVEEIETAIAQIPPDHKWNDVFTAEEIRARLLIGMALQAFQQLTGINYFFYYGTSVFVGVGIDNPYVTAMILGGVNVGATCFSLLLVEACGRRISLMVGALFQTVCFLVFASVGHFCFLAAQQSGDQDGMKSYGAVMIVFACLFICSFACTWGPIAWVVVGEIYPYRYKATAIAFASCSNWIWNFLIAFFTPFITSAIDFRYGYVFAGCNFLAFLLVYFFVIETKGVSLEEADKLYRDKTPARGSSKLAKSLARKKKNREAAGLTTADLRPVDDAHRSAADEVAVEV